MKNNIDNYWYLMEFLNESNMNSTDADIARFLFENRAELENLSLNQIAAEGYFSTATLSRFFHKHGLEHFEDYRIGNVRTKAFYDNYYQGVSDIYQNMDTEEIAGNVAEKMKSVIDDTASVSANEIEKTVQELSEADRVIFLGSKMSVSLVYGLQSELVYDGISAYAPSDYAGQETMIKDSREGDLIIVISIKGRWYSFDPVLDFHKDLFASKAKKVLWTPMQKHLDEEKFDHVFRIGSGHKEFGYTALSMIVPVLMNVYATHVIHPNNNSGLPFKGRII